MKDEQARAITAAIDRVGDKISQMVLAYEGIHRRETEKTLENIKGKRC